MIHNSWLFNYYVHRTGSTIWVPREASQQQSKDKKETMEGKKTHHADKTEAIGHGSSPVFLEKL